MSTSGSSGLIGVAGVVPLMLAGEHCAPVAMSTRWLIDWPKNHCVNWNQKNVAIAHRNSGRSDAGRVPVFVDWPSTSVAP